MGLQAGVPARIFPFLVQERMHGNNLFAFGYSISTFVNVRRTYFQFVVQKSFKPI